jgi:hypothetical protein
MVYFDGCGGPADRAGYSSCSAVFDTLTADRSGRAAARAVLIARTLGSCIRIALGATMYVCLLLCLCCVYRGIAMGGHLFKEPYQLSVIYVSEDNSVWERPVGLIRNNNNDYK